MKIRLLYFAVLRDIAGAAETNMELPEGTRAADVWERLRTKYEKLSGYAQPPMVAINESYATPESLLRDGDELAFIPPVAGG